MATAPRKPRLCYICVRRDGSAVVAVSVRSPGYSRSCRLVAFYVVVVESALGFVVRVATIASPASFTSLAQTLTA
eukprot:3454981-Prorocentrum_lima.AAC.1